MGKKKRQERRLETYVDLVEKAEQHRDTSFKDDWVDSYKRWRNYVDDTGGKLDDGTKRSNMSIPFTFSQVETIVPRIVNAMFPSRPYVSVLPRVPMVGDNAKQHEILLDYQMNAVQYFPHIFQDIIRTAVIYGYGVAYTGWQRAKKLYITEREVEITDAEGFPMADADGETLKDLEEQVIEDTFLDDPVVKAIDPALFFYDYNASNLDDARFCGHVSYDSEEELKKMQQLGVYSINWDETDSEQARNEIKDERTSSIGMTSGERDVMQDENDQHELIHYWENDRYVVILDRMQVIRESKNPFIHKKKPYDVIPYTRIPHEIGGIGMVEMMKDLQDELNTERNMRMEYRKYVVRPMFALRKNSGLTPRDLVAYPGKVFELDEVDDLRALQMPDIDSTTFVQENTIKQDMKDTTGAHDIIMGLHTPGEESATTTVTKDNNAGSRFKLVIDNMNSGLQSIAEKMLSMNQQFLEDPRFIREYASMNDKFAIINPHSLLGEFTLTPVSATEEVGNIEAHRQRLIQLYSILNSDPLFNANMLKKRNFLKKIAEAFGIKTVDEILPSDEEIEAMQGQAEEAANPQEPGMALLGAQQGAPGQPAPPPPSEVDVDQFQNMVPDMGEVPEEERGG